MINFNKSLAVIGFLLFLSLSSCSVEPQEIKYGNVHCHHCDMTVVDKSHAAEYVTKKGKAYFFDAAECLIMKLNDDKNEHEMAFILVSDINNPGNLIDAVSASFVVSEAIKSPMGANLASFNSQKTADDFSAKNGGIVYNWSTIKSQLSK
ncbi:MAG TPA: hypothetical protein EYG86_06120 [Crocinitomicaceae bacterium]|nr:hypothetical protein [Crocinitomicaceae bacterium]